MTPIREEIVKGLELLHRGTVKGLFPEEVLPDLHHDLQLLVASVALRSMEALPPDDRCLDHDALVAQLEASIDRLSSESD